MAWMTGNAQNYFEGMLKARSFENYGGDYERASGGQMINGVRDVEYYVKGDKIAILDHTTKSTPSTMPVLGRRSFLCSETSTR